MCQGREKIIVQLRDGKNTDMGSCSLLYVCSEEEFGNEANITIYDFPKKKEMF